MLAFALPLVALAMFRTSAPLCTVPYRLVEDEVVFDISVGGGKAIPTFLATYSSESFAKTGSKEPENLIVSVGGVELVKTQILPMDEEWDDPRASAMLSCDVLKNYVVGIDRVKKQLTFWKSSDWTEKTGNDWLGNGSTVSTSIHKLEPLSEGGFFVKLKSEGRNLKVLFDTSEGMTRVYGDKFSAATEIDKDENSATHFLPAPSCGGSDVFPWIEAFQQPQIDTFTSEDAPDGSATLATLGGSRILIDLPNSQLITIRQSPQDALVEYLSAQCYLPTKIENGKMYVKSPGEFIGSPVNMNDVNSQEIVSIAGVSVADLISTFSTPDVDKIAPLKLLWKRLFKSYEIVLKDKDGKITNYPMQID